MAVQCRFWVGIDCIVLYCIVLYFTESLCLTYSTVFKFTVTPVCLLYHRHLRHHRHHSCDNASSAAIILYHFAHVLHTFSAQLCL